MAFAAQVGAVCDLYAAALSTKGSGAHLVSTDEMTGIQALERAASDLPMQPGHVRRQEFEYIRHGTRSLIASFEVATGTIIQHTIGPTRTEADFAAHIAQTIAGDPAASWTFILDQLNTHKSESLVRLVAAQEGLTLDLGTKGETGILHTMATRAAFLSDATHRIRFVYVPKHTSWLNQIEIWFSTLVRRLLRRGNFHSVEQLTEQILAFIAYKNLTARPYKWTYTGATLVA